MATRSDLLIRLGSAALLVAVAGPLVVAGGPWLAALATVAAAQSWREYAGLLSAVSRRVDVWGGGLLVIAAAGLPLLPPAFWPLLWTLTVPTLAIRQFALPAAQRSLDDILATVAGVLWIAPGVFSAVVLRSYGGSTAGLSWFMSGVSIVVACDTCAYVGGRTLGKHEFFPSISPKKTVEGVVAGISAGMIVGTIIALVWLSLPWIVGSALGLVVSSAAVAGDLWESFVKRQCGVKDSGALIPGHGGLLDRIDSWLFAFPALLSCVILIGHG